MEMETSLVINETRGLFLMSKRVGQLLDLLKGNESKKWSPHRGFRGTKTGKNEVIFCCTPWKAGLSMN